MLYMEMSFGKIVFELNVQSLHHSFGKKESCDLKTRLRTILRLDIIIVK